MPRNMDGYLNHYKSGIGSWINDRDGFFITGFLLDCYFIIIGIGDHEKIENKNKELEIITKKQHKDIKNLTEKLNKLHNILEKEFRCTE